MKIAIVHDYLHEYGGAEAVVNAIRELYPEADIYSATYDAKVMQKAGAFQGAKIYYPQWKNEFLGPFYKFFHKLLIANLPLYFESLNLRKYDLIISSSAHFAKGVITGPNQLHVSYIHTPPRFLYGYPGETRKRDSKYWRIILDPLDSVLRIIDFNFAQRPDYLLCNSEVVRQRIKKFYRRNAKVIHPFPEVKATKEDLKEVRDEGFYLVLGRLAAYKNADLVIKTLGKKGLPLKVAGTGPSSERLNELSGNYNSVEMLGFVSASQKAELYKTCKAVICAVKDEDFGMVPLEPMTYGKPVIALRDSGYLETVVENRSGIFFDKLTEESLLEALGKFNKTRFDHEFITKHAQSFNKDRFKVEFEQTISNLLHKRSKFSGIGT